ncbi:hypothetical protein CLG96_09875 [Sphingomonas oleivorans]|uniref:Translocation and assembly module TamB C-terminal domain-containing protein n=1 Tax=Sphingomonas oleivorans TaxID=1735121 RepID=A0A2T5FX57_9SPHN|nr:translocation/assembly module TamB domain-containing protein [Sphingomonas oleivorans]PTQ10712.1 hypothetical protein CLG96_09875 [Sphingomonas oleivorans]
MAEETPSPARHRGRTVLKWIAILFGGLIALVALLLLGLNSGPGRDLVRRQLAAYETASGLNIRAGRIDGSLYGRMLLRDVEIRDPKGAFLTVPALTLDWRPFAYARSKIDIRELSATQARLIRLPELKPVPSEPDAPILPDIDLALGRLRVDRLVVEPAVTGRLHIVRFAGMADLADRRARISADAMALAASGVAGGDRLALRLDAAPDANRLLIDANLAAPAGGLVDSFAKLGKPLTFAVNGRGDWANWRGRAVGRLAGAPLANLAILGRDGDFRVKGALRPGLALGGPAARLTEPRVDLDLLARLDERRADTRLVARSGALALDAAGLIDLGQSRFGNFRLNGRLLTPGAIADNVRGRDVAFQALLDGPFATPIVEYRLRAAALGFGETLVEGLDARGRARVDADRILIPVSATARRVAGLNAAAGGLLTNISINGDLAYGDGKLLSDNLRLRSDRIDATAILFADIAGGTYTGALKGRVNDYQVDGIGRIALVTDAELVTAPGGGFGIRGRVRVTTRRLDNASLRDQLGGNAVITADVGFTQEGVATIRNLRMASPRFRITGGEGSYRPDGRIAFRAVGSSTQYGALAVAISGTADQPLVRLRAPRPYVGVQLRDVEAELVGTAQGYEVRARGGSTYGPFLADLLIRSDAGPLALDIRTARFAGIDFGGRIVQTAAGPFDGTLRLSGSGLAGTMRLAAAGAHQRADFDLRAASARIPGDVPITIGSGTIRATAILYPDAPEIVGAVSLANIQQGEYLLSRLQGRVRYRAGQGNAALIASGNSGLPFDIALQAALSPTAIRANIRGTANDIAFRLARPAEIVKIGGGWQLQPATILLPQGEVDLSGDYGAATTLHARLRNVDLALAQAFAPGLGLGGKASGTIDYALPSGKTVPVARARLDIARFTRTSALTISDPLDVALLGTLSDAGGDMRALIRRGAAIVGRLQARLAPLGKGAGLGERLFAAPLSGGIRYNGPAEMLWALTGIAGQSVSGPVAVAADFGGRLDRPTLNGLIRANALRYENEAYGTVLSNMAVAGRFTQSRLDLTSLTARAGRGSVTARGTIGLDAASGFPIDLTAQLDGAQLARSDALGATVSGTLAITNNQAEGALIRGDLNIPEARYRIIRQGAAEVTELTGVRRKGAPAVPPEPPSAAPSIWKLDLRVHANNQIFVSGMGLEAEWRTDLRVTGTASDPRIIGEMEVVRGTYSFAGRRFDLDNGTVTFQGGPVTDPALSIAASTSVEGVTATINIGGRATNPQISFTSTPALPQDEVLARLLFGTSVTTLSPTQAIQLAAALNSLRGSGGGLNPLGKLRSATGIDRLRVLGADRAAGRGTALAAGQYISNRIYVEIITDARGFTATQLEISLSRALSLLSQAGSFGGSNVSLRYKKDY